MLLLDENLPKRLKEDFHGHTIYTIKETGLEWFEKWCAVTKTSGK